MPVYRIEKFKNGSAIAVWEITETEEELMRMSSVPNNELEELQYISSPARRCERLAVRVLLDKLLDEKAYVGYHENGRPYLQNDTADISISHTKRFACVYHHPSANVGIDIELLTRDFSAVEARILSNEEREYLADDRRNEQLCIIWCAKEAVFKLMCQPAVDFSKQITIEKFNPKEKGKLSATFTTIDNEIIKLPLRYCLFDDHAMAWVEEA